jgi:hypothetical protein
MSTMCDVGSVVKSRNDALWGWQHSHDVSENFLSDALTQHASATQNSCSVVNLQSL